MPKKKEVSKEGAELISEPRSVCFQRLWSSFLAVPGLSCNTQAPPSSLQHAESFTCCTWDLVPNQGLNPGSLH